jgi:hypothetical protein
LSYGAAIVRESRRWDSNPQPPACEACTPNRQSVVFPCCSRQAVGLIRNDTSGSLRVRPNVHKKQAQRRGCRDNGAWGHQVSSLDVVPAGSWACTATCCPAPDHQPPLRYPGPAEGQRRRWESNPLGPGCSRLPCRLAPASGFQCPRQESNLVCDLRGVACDPAHSEDVLLCCCRPFSTPPRSRTSSCRFEVCRAVRHTCRACHSSSPSRNRTWSNSFGS